MHLYSASDCPFALRNTSSLACSFSPPHLITSAFFRTLSTSAFIFLMTRSPYPALFHRLLPRLESAELTPTHVEPHVNLLSSSAVPWAVVRELSQSGPCIHRHGRRRGGLRVSDECGLRRGVLFFDGIVLSHGGILPFFPANNKASGWAIYQPT